MKRKDAPPERVDWATMGVFLALTSALSKDETLVTELRVLRERLRRLEVNAEAELQIGEIKVDAEALIKPFEHLSEFNPRVASGALEPPRLAEFALSSLSPKRHREALLGDMEEEFRQNLFKGMSVRRARMLYWSAVLASLRPQLFRLARKAGGAVLLFDFFRRIIGK